ncbi:hypothetical protein NONI108955_07495 [Nocardia ninae]|uniref:Uncharacterized protein n=1 Tax=Nocardia ninae NBRC 108245 TaxID=1210091 RepID=A0A511M665_9NOCA|nr:hypothetical protein [Nocardia ninae]GEM36133.1 hypothetical protein NN4_06520 [Nocardia ninae NBRC 108245]
MDRSDANGYRDRLAAAYRASELTVNELWLRYFALGGIIGRMEMEAYLSGLMELPPLQHDMLALAINERLDEIAPARAPYLPVDPPESVNRETGGPAANPVTSRRTPAEPDTEN